MTGVADLYLYLKRPYSKDRRKRLVAHFQTNDSSLQRFVVLSWKRTGSNLLCGILNNHPEITMHSELFNPIDIFTYHPGALKLADTKKPLWTVLTRDLCPENFLDFIWSGNCADGVTPINPKARTVGFKSFPDHWQETRNEPVWQENVLEDLRVKKVILHRQDELAVFVSMKRAEMTGLYMTHGYPKGLKIHIDPADFQTFVNNYRNTFRRKYRSPIEKRDTFWITYEQLEDLETFEAEILPKLWDFLGVKRSKLRLLKETVRQADPNEDLATVIDNYGELEFCFRHSDVLHFEKKRNESVVVPICPTLASTSSQDQSCVESWSILLPICSRNKASQVEAPHGYKRVDEFNTNRFLELALSSQHSEANSMDRSECWDMLQTFATSLWTTSTFDQLRLTEILVGIDVDDSVFATAEARERIKALLPCNVVFVDIHPPMYGQLCKIWNLLARQAKHDFVVLLGDDVRLLDEGWQRRIVKAFHEISLAQSLPFGAACVAMNDLSFPGFPTFPVLHRWHMNHFGSLLPKQFANQGGDPYLYELYGRFNAAKLDVSCRLENTIGGDGDARYEKYHINWRGQILTLHLRHLTGFLGLSTYPGLCLDVVVPSYRVNNDDYLRRIALLRASTPMYVKFWFVVDNPLQSHVDSVKALAAALNATQLRVDGNYFVNVVHYSENRGASYARNTGYNYTTADWVLFLDDDVIPDPNILDAYAGAIRRYPDGKVFVGMTNLPAPCGLWTEMLRACNVGYFYGIAKRMVHPSWGVTANLLVRGSRHNPTIQFKEKFPRTGGGEDIDFVYQFKEWYASLGRRVTVGVPEAVVQHPWWNGGQPCYKQIMGWAWGDSLCITEWPHKTFVAFPNWIEHVAFIVTPLTIRTGQWLAGGVSSLALVVLEHVIKTANYFSDAQAVTGGSLGRASLVALGAGSVLSSQEVTRVGALLRRGSLWSVCRRVDWFDGEEPRIKLDVQLGSLFRFGLNGGLTWFVFRQFQPRARTG